MTTVSPSSVPVEIGSLGAELPHFCDENRRVLSPGADESRQMCRPPCASPKGRPQSLLPRLRGRRDLADLPWPARATDLRADERADLDANFVEHVVADSSFAFCTTCAPVKTLDPIRKRRARLAARRSYLERIALDLSVIGQQTIMPFLPL